MNIESKCFPKFVKGSPGTLYVVILRVPFVFTHSRSKTKIVFKMYIYFSLQDKNKFIHFLRFLVLRLDLSPEYRAVALVQPTFFCSLKILHVQFQHKISCFAS